MSAEGFKRPETQVQGSVDVLRRRKTSQGPQEGLSSAKVQGVTLCPCRCITRSFYRNMVGVLLVFDVTNRKSFEHIRDWHQDVLATQGPDKAIFLLIGHKSDLQSARCISAQEAEELAASLGMGFVETSAKSNHNVELAFDTLVDAIQQALQQGDIKLEEDWGGVRLIHKAPGPRPSSRKHPPGSCQC